MYDINAKVLEAQTTLDKNNVWGTAYQYHTLPVIAVEISWGDWKHAHWRTDYLMEELGFQKIKVDVTEEDGSDCYSAIHYYMAM